MFEKPEKPQFVRIKIEAVSLDSTSMASSLEGLLPAEGGRFKTATTDPYETLALSLDEGRLATF